MRSNILPGVVPAARAVLVWHLGHQMFYLSQLKVCPRIKMLQFPFCFSRNKACIWSADDSGAISTGGDRVLKVLSRQEQHSAASSVRWYHFYSPYSALNYELK